MTTLIPAKAIYRYEVPIDDDWHTFQLTGHILHVGCRKEGAVEFWAHHIGSNPPEEVRLRVYGTGHELPYASVYRGTAFSAPIGVSPFVIPAGRLVWHLVQAVDADLYADLPAPPVSVAG